MVENRSSHAGGIDEMAIHAVNDEVRWDAVQGRIERLGYDSAPEYCTKAGWRPQGVGVGEDIL